MKDLNKLFEAVEEDFNLEGFAKPSTPTFRVNTLLQKALIQFDIDYPEVHQPFISEDFKYPKRSGGVNSYREFRDDWYAYINYYVTKNKAIIYIYGNLISPESSYYSFRYYYNKRTEEISKTKPLSEAVDDMDDVSDFSEPNDWRCPECNQVGEEIIPNKLYRCNNCGIEWGPDVDDEWDKKGWHLDEATEDDFGEISDFDRPPRAKNFDKKSILKLILDNIEQQIPGSPKFPAEEECRKCAPRMGSGVPAWRYHIVRSGIGDIQIEVDPKEDRTEADIFVTVRWGLKGGRYTHVENKYFLYVKGANELSSLKEAVEEDFGSLESFEKPAQAKTFNRKAILQMLLNFLRSEGIQDALLPKDIEISKLASPSSTGKTGWKWEGILKRTPKTPYSSTLEVHARPTSDMNSVYLWVLLKTWTPHSGSGRNPNLKIYRYDLYYTKGDTFLVSGTN